MNALLAAAQAARGRGDKAGVLAALIGAAELHRDKAVPISRNALHQLCLLLFQAGRLAEA